jgi:DNA-binding GntR family transcriptional regulator
MAVARQKKVGASNKPRGRRRGNGPSDGARQQEAYEQIRQEILDANYPAGAPLSEYQLAERIGVSRTPVREALKRLQQEGLVHAVARRGTFVAEIDVEDVVEIYEIRDKLEVFAATMAATRMDREVARRLLAETEVVGRASSARRIALAREEDLHVHKEIIASTANRRLIQILATLDDQVHRIRALALAGDPRIEATLREHAAIIGAIIRGDSDAAGDAMRSHLRAARDNAIRLALGGKGLQAAQLLSRAVDDDQRHGRSRRARRRSV